MGNCNTSASVASSPTDLKKDPRMQSPPTNGDLLHDRVVRVADLSQHRPKTGEEPDVEMDEESGN
jgi:hypothetical protein